MRVEVPCLHGSLVIGPPNNSGLTTKLVPIDPTKWVGKWVSGSTVEYLSDLFNQNDLILNEISES